MKTTFQVLGGAELAAKLNSLSTRLSKRVKRDALEVAGEPIRVDMSQMAPRAPGAPDLADHMAISTARVEGVLDNEHNAAIAIGPERDFYYGFFQEEGTAHHGAQPFARPAFDRGVDAALVSITRSLWTALAAVGISRSVSAPTSVESEGRFL